MNKIKEYVPLVTIGVILLGVFNIDNYYSKFKIDIYSYLDTSEILFSFGSLFTNTVTSILTMSMLAVVYIRYNSETQKYELIPKNKKVFILIAILFVITMSIVIVKMVIGSIDFITTAPTISILSSCLFMLLYDIFVNKQDTFPFARIYLRSILVFIFIVVILRQLNEFKYQKIISGNPKYHIELSLSDGKSIRTSKDFVFVGSTRNFYFFTNIKSKLNTIIPTSEVKEVRQKELRETI